jgi:hypothetical protein
MKCQILLILLIIILALIIVNIILLEIKQKVKNIHGGSKFIKICNWNIENMVAIDYLFSEDNKTFLNELMDIDLLLIQEWVINGTFIKLLKNNHFSYSVVDRVAVIYKDTYILKYYKPIELIYENPHLLEKVYTSGRQKSNILVKLKNSLQFPIYVVSFHLSAYSPNLHPDFHKKQLTNLFKKAISHIQAEVDLGKVSKFGFIFGGDTNYRQLYTKKHNYTFKNLQDELFNTSLFNDFESMVYKSLIDICRNNCITQPTQSFKCINEKTINKKIAKWVSTWSMWKEKTDEYATNSFQDSRLDLILTNLNPTDTRIEKKCLLSDHSALFSKLEIK